MSVHMIRVAHSHQSNPRHPDQSIYGALQSATSCGFGANVTRTSLLQEDGFLDDQYEPVRTRFGRPSKTASKKEGGSKSITLSSCSPARLQHGRPKLSKMCQNTGVLEQEKEMMDPLH